MNIAAFNERIMDTVLDKCRPIVILLVIALILLGIELVYYVVTKSNKGFSLLNTLPIRHIFQNRFSTKNQIALHCIVIVVLLIYLVCTIAPAYQDMQNSQYKQVCAQYICEENVYSRSPFSNGYVRIESEEHSFYLELPRNWDASEFPVGTHYGLVSYSEKSKILLSFQSEPVSE